jgi:hypothetical protein
MDQQARESDVMNILVVYCSCCQCEAVSELWLLTAYCSFPTWYIHEYETTVE